MEWKFETIFFTLQEAGDVGAVAENDEQTQKYRHDF